MDTLQHCTDTDAGGRHFLSKKMQVGWGKSDPVISKLWWPHLCVSEGKALRIVGLCKKVVSHSCKIPGGTIGKGDNLRWAGSNLPNSGAIRKKDSLLPTEHSFTKWSLPSFIEKLPYTTGNTQAPQPEVQENYFTTRAIFPFIPGCPAALPLLSVAWIACLIQDLADNKLSPWPHY